MAKTMSSMAGKKKMTRVVVKKRKPEQSIGTASTYRKPPASGGRKNVADGGLRNVRRSGGDVAYVGQGAKPRREGTGPTNSQRAKRGYEAPTKPRKRALPRKAVVGKGTKDIMNMIDFWNKN